MEESLVVAVSSYPELYDFTNRNYHNINKKQLAWKKISLAIEISKEECKRKWKYLRDKYLKERRTEKEKQSGAEGGRHKRWKFMAIMSFLEPHVKERPTTSNCYLNRPIDSQESSVESLLLPMMSQVEVGSS
nr:transcription factor Adf-1-like [Misgurnus anguillicaudatus]